MRVAVGGLHFDDALTDFEDGDVEGAAAEVVDGDRLVLLLVEPVGERRGGRLVDDAHHLEAGDAARLLGRLPLRVVEVGRHGDDGLGDRLPEIVLCGLFEFLQNHRGQLRRRVVLTAGLHSHVAVAGADDFIRHHPHFFVHLVEAASHEPLDREDGVFGIGDGLALGDLSDQPLAGLAEGDDGRRQAAAFGVLNDGWLIALHDRHDRIGGSEVDADDFAHALSMKSEWLTVKAQR